MSEIVTEFMKCLDTLSYVRAGWDFELSREQRAQENRDEKVALARARAIWSDNPTLQDELRAAFKAKGRLATMREIEAAP